MNAREYLSQVALYRAKIVTERSVGAIEDVAYNTEGSNDDVIERYMDMINVIAQQIKDLDKPTHIEILTRKYIDGQKLQDAADEMCYSYDRIRHIHKDALDEFQKKYIDTQ